jgi:L-rhamnose-H+ transport protein
MGEIVNSASLLSGIVLITIGAFANGSFGLQLKRSGEWRWEHMWLIYSVFAMVVIPWLLGFATVPHLLDVLGSANWGDIARIFLFGLGWGFGSVLYGIALKLVGLGLTYAIVMGLTAAIGSLAPLVLLHGKELPTLRGALIVSGVTIVVVGVLAAAWAGQLKAAGASQVTGRSFVPGLLAAVLSGVLSPMLNLSFAYGAPVAKLAVAHGTPPLFAANAIWRMWPSRSANCSSFGCTIGAP